MKKISRQNLTLLWNFLARKYTLYLPLEEDGIVNFAPWKEGVRVNLAVLNTVVPPKNLIFPQSETYLRFRSEDRRVLIESVEPREEQYIIFGIRPCDVASFAVLDKVFLDDPVDGLYLKRRQGGTLISLVCDAPGETCFCTSFGLEPGFAPEADIMVQDSGEILFWEPQSEKGKALTQLVADLQLLEEATVQEAEAAKKLRNRVFHREVAAAAEKGLLLKGISQALREHQEAGIWEKIYRRCLGCGICTYLCPTCHCFDIEDYSRGQVGGRFRCWDSCMFTEFTLMASGENPRPTQKERVRWRFLHKLLYFPEKYGLFACVGCGRCIRNCPVHLDITAVIGEFSKKVSGEQ